MKFDVITAFRVAEHLRDPMDILENLGEHSDESWTLGIKVPNSNAALFSMYDNHAYGDFSY